MLLHKTISVLCSQYYLMFHIHAATPNFDQLMAGSDRTHWPLKSGYPGLSVTNLNEYVSLFSHCLVHIQNYQGIEIIGIKSPIYITRFDVALLWHCNNPSDSHRHPDIHRFMFGKNPPKSTQNCSTSSHEDETLKIKYKDASFTRSWTCTAQFDLFFPELVDAPHIVYHAMLKKERNLLDISPEDTKADPLHREGWSKFTY